MDKITRDYIDKIVKPLTSRIEILQKNNEELKNQVKYLESLIHFQKAYLKPTLSTANHIRESRISSREGADSQGKRPGWSSKTKVDQSPSAGNKQPIPHDKMKLKPPIPKMMKSPNKVEGDDLNKLPITQKKISGGARIYSQRNQHQNQEQHQLSPIKQEILSPPKKVEPENEPQMDLSKESGVGILNNKFEQLVKYNTEILTDMKQNNNKIREDLQATNSTSNNYVQKVVAPKSQYNHSHTTSPNQRSYISESHPIPNLMGLKINLDCNLAKLELK